MTTEYDPTKDAIGSYYAAIEAKRARGDAESDVLGRLRILHAKLESEGLYVRANTVWLAMEEISHVRALLNGPAEEDDGQPDEATEWRDYDPDC